MNPTTRDALVAVLELARDAAFFDDRPQLATAITTLIDALQTDETIV